MDKKGTRIALMWHPSTYQAPNVFKTEMREEAYTTTADNARTVFDAPPIPR